MNDKEAEEINDLSNIDGKKEGANMIIEKSKRDNKGFKYGIRSHILDLDQEPDYKKGNNNYQKELDNYEFTPYTKHYTKYEKTKGGGNIDEKLIEDLLHHFSLKIPTLGSGSNKKSEKA